jgi:hypothetical protein
MYRESILSKSEILGSLLRMAGIQLLVNRESSQHVCRDCWQRPRITEESAKNY